MLMESKVAVGIDLGRNFSQITFCSKTDMEPISVVQTAADGSKSYRIPTPKGMFLRVEQKQEQAVEDLADYFTYCFELLKGAGNPRNMTIMVTMHEMKMVWADAIREALGSLGISREDIFLQGHLESFFYYVMNQKKELSMYHVALLEYGRDHIIAWELGMDHRTRPVLVKTRKCFRLFLDGKARMGRGDAEWNKLRDELLHKEVEKMFDNTPFSSVYLVGEDFHTGWMEKSLKFLCRKRHVFQGDNLYTRGACYAAMEENGAQMTKGMLYAGDDMVEHNLGMWMNIRGEYSYYPLVNAGINWYMAEHTCELLLDGEEELVLYSKSIRGEELEHTVPLAGLPKRPQRADRIRLNVKFKDRNRCSIFVEDLGLGEFYPSSEKTWEVTLQLP